MGFGTSLAGPGTAHERAEDALEVPALRAVSWKPVGGPPEAPGSWAQAGRVPALLVRDALRTAEMLRKEMQLVGGGLVRQLVQALLGG